MIKNKNRALYESLMKNVSKQVKRSLNESFESFDTEEYILVAKIDEDRSFVGDVHIFHSDEAACNKFREFMAEYTDDEDEIEDALDDGYYDTPDNETIILDTCILH